MEDGDRWYAVRCVFGFGADTAWAPTDLSAGHHTYEERVTLWRAASADVAIGQAEEEAIVYASRTGCEYSGLAQSYALVEPPRHGGEVFSLMRDSAETPDDYLDRFFDTGAERQSHSGREDAPSRP